MSKALARGLAALLLLFPPGARAQQHQAPEADLKAAILVNMLLFVEWPARNPGTPGRLTFCHLDDSPVAAALQSFNGRSMRGRHLQVARISVDRLGECQALYLAERERSLLPRLLPATESAGIFLMADLPGAYSRGVMVNLAVAAGRVVFDVDLRAVRQAELALSSQVLRLARLVQE